jgi:hypothetical protein
VRTTVGTTAPMCMSKKLGRVPLNTGWGSRYLRSEAIGAREQLAAHERHIRANIFTCSGARYGPVKDVPNAETE